MQLFALQACGQQAGTTQWRLIELFPAICAAPHGFFAERAQRIQREAQAARDTTGMLRALLGGKHKAK